MLEGQQQEAAAKERQARAEAEKGADEREEEEVQKVGGLGCARPVLEHRQPAAAAACLSTEGGLGTGWRSARLALLLPVVADILLCLLRGCLQARAWDDFKDDNPRGWGNSKLRPCA